MSKMFYTIGYGGRKPTDFLKLLSDYSINVVIDVRENPKQAFLGCYAKAKTSNHGIERLLFEKGIKYVWIQELGNPFRNVPDWPKYYREYISNHWELFHNKLLSLSGSPCLLCCEKDPINCHRSIIAEFLRNDGYEVINII